MTAAEWLERYGVTFDWSAEGFHADADGWEHQRFTLLLSAAGATLTVPWRHGMGLADDPTPESTLWAVANDARAGRMSWDEFADEYGYDVHDAPLSQYRSWEACRDLAAELETFCAALEGDAFGDFLELEEES